MSTRADTLRRRLSGALVRHAASVMPSPLQHWADAMRSELAYVADDRQALRWAIGCLLAAHNARLRGLYLLDVPAVRAVGVIIASFCAFDAVLPTLLTMAYRLGAFGMTESLGRMTPGDDYRRLVPLMEAIPPWVHALSIAGGTFYLVAVVCLLGRRRAAHVALLLGVSVGLALTVIGRFIVADAGVSAVPDPSFLAAVLLPFVLPLLVAVAAWSGSRQESNRPAAR